MQEALERVRTGVAEMQIAQSSTPREAGSPINNSESELVLRPSFDPVNAAGVGARFETGWIMSVKLE